MPARASLSSKFQTERVVTLKDGRRAVVRDARMSDAQGVLESNRLVHGAGVGVVRTVDELPQSVEAQERELAEWVTGKRSGPNGAMVVGEVGGRIVGEAVARRYTQGGLRHVAHIGIGVVPEFQGLGLGRALMQWLIDWARVGPGRGVVRLDLSVFQNNARAIRLYESLGFVKEGVRKRFVRLPDGSEIDDVLMVLFLDEEQGPEGQKSREAE